MLTFKNEFKWNNKGSETEYISLLEVILEIIFNS
jgi:hypothetical protein